MSDPRRSKLCLKKDNADNMLSTQMGFYYKDVVYGNTESLSLHWTQKKKKKKKKGEEYV